MRMVVRIILSHTRESMFSAGVPTMLCFELRWRPIIWRRRAALLSVASPPWARWRAFSTAGWVKKTPPLLLKSSSLSAAGAVQECWSIFIARKKSYTVPCLSNSLVTSRRLPGDHWGKELRHLSESIHQLALPGGHFMLQYYEMDQHRHVFLFLWYDALPSFK